MGPPLSVHYFCVNGFPDVAHAAARTVHAPLSQACGCSSVEPRSDSLPISSIRPSIRPSDVRMPRISFSRFMVSSFGKRATKRHEETQESMPLCGLLELGGHMRDRIAPIAIAGGAGSAHTEQVGRSGNEVADGDRAGIGEQAGALPIAWSVVGAECCELDLKDPRIGNRVQLEDKLRAFAGIDADDHRLRQR